MKLIVYTHWFVYSVGPKRAFCPKFWALKIILPRNRFWTWIRGFNRGVLCYCPCLFIFESQKG